jgi:hypothetical protein
MPISETGSPMAMIDQHLRVEEVAKRLGVSRQTVERRFAGLPGVRDLGTSKKRMLLIPESLLEQSLCDLSLQQGSSGGGPSGVVLLRDLYGRMPKKDFKVIQTKTLRKHANREGIA